MTLETHTRPVSRRFMELFRRFPIRPIHGEAEYEEAAAVLDTLAIRDEGTLGGRRNRD